MDKLDIKDRKILYHLYLDSRQSFTKIGKKVGLKKELVAYRVSKLQERGIIKNFFTSINTFKLGYTSIRFYFTFQYVTPEIKKEIINYFVKNKYTRYIHQSEGHYNLVVIIVIKNIIKFSYIWEKIYNKYSNYFANHVFSVGYEYSEYNLSFLLDEINIEQKDRIESRHYNDGDIIKIDEIDRKIINLIATNARMPTKEIAEKLNSSAVTINNRIRNLMKLGVIVGFKVNINFPRLGYQWHKVDICLKDPSKGQKIKNYIEKNPNLIGNIKSLGYVDLELLFCLKNTNQLHKILGDISEKFPDSIINYTYFYTTKTHKYQSFLED
jgi:DNA-binding Lrp family transcriptional regulator